ncbi:MAG: hypothetical protein D6732_20660 [Methanobacteriota archaeon]|nr:MAG: hypothetical protein D6732_20660 [Euryarchaeota archaeon]
MATTEITADIGQEDLEYRRKMVRETKNKDVLAKYALDDEFWEIRREATSRIHDEKVLQKIATKDDYWQVRFEAVGKIKDQDFLHKIVKNDEQVWVCKEALSNLIDPELLCDIILDKALDLSVRIKAIGQLNQLDVLSSLRPKVDNELQSTIMKRIREIQGY